MVVVLSAPFGPRMPVTAPRAALSVSPSTAVVWPYRLTSAPISTAGVCGTVLTDASLRRSESAPCCTSHLGAALSGSLEQGGALGVEGGRRGAHAFSLGLPCCARTDVTSCRPPSAPPGSARSTCGSRAVL